MLKRRVPNNNNNNNKITDLVNLVRDSYEK